MLTAKPSPTPYNTSLKLHSITPPSYHDPTQYYHLIGQLIDLITTCPIISFVVQQLSQFVATPTDLHFK